MSQTYQELQGNTPLTSSRPIINNNMDALKTNFSGTAAPFTASADTLGATYYNTTDRKTYQVVASGSSYIWAVPPENVHTSGDESIAGAKTFTSDITAPNITTLTSTVSTLSSTAAHLAGTETFTGNKTFSGTVALGSSATAETKTATTNSTAVATTAYVKLLVPVSIGSGVKPVYTNASGIITASNSDVGSSTQPVYMDKGEIKAITGAIANGTTGNAATATKLNTAINITIKDADETNSGTTASFDGSANTTLKLPSTIKASLTGTATKATADSDGNTISSTYAKVGSNNTFTGTNTFSTANGLNAVTAVMLKRNDTLNGGAIKFDGADNEPNASKYVAIERYNGQLVIGGNDSSDNWNTPLVADIQNNIAYATTPAVSDNSTKIATTAFIGNKFQVVSALPASPDANTFYFVTE